MLGSKVGCVNKLNASFLLWSAYKYLGKKADTPKEQQGQAVIYRRHVLPNPAYPRYIGTVVWHVIPGPFLNYKLFTYLFLKYTSNLNIWRDIRKNKMQAIFYPIS